MARQIKTKGDVDVIKDALMAEREPRWREIAGEQALVVLPHDSLETRTTLILRAIQKAFSEHFDDT